MAGKGFAGLATAFVAGTMAISGCGGSEPTVASVEETSIPTPTTYNDEVEHNFVSSCVDSANTGSTPTAESDAERICGCMYDELKARMSFEEFKAADESLRQGEKMSADLASTLQAAATACA
jgi:hypothetical protein